MRRSAVGVLAGLFLVLALGLSPAAAQGMATVEPGPAAANYLLPPCNDIAIQVEERRSFVLRRDGAVDTPLTVTYGLSGSAVAGVHYDPLPGSVTYPPGVSTVSVDVTPRPTPEGAIVDLTLTVPGSASSTASSATIRFVSPPPPGPVECGYSFTADLWNTAQTVAVGQALHPLTLEQFTPPVRRPATGRFRVLGGSLPPGVALGEDGSFAGAPTLPGTYVARIEACRPQPPGTCITTDLTVTVQGGSPPDPFAALAALPQLIADTMSAFLQRFGDLVQQLLGSLLR